MTERNSGIDGGGSIDGGRAVLAAPRPTLPGGAELVVVEDLAAAGREAAGRIARALAAAVAEHRRADWATTGGSAAPPVYAELAGRLRDAVPWPAVHLWWGDERFVPRDHPLSNARLAEQGLLGAAAFSGQSGFGASGVDIARGGRAGVVLPRGNVHSVPVEAAFASGGGPAVAAAAYSAELRHARLRVTDGWPVFDVVLLGVGPDGHVLSVFPDSAAWDSSAWAVDVPAPTHVEPHVARVTLHPRILSAARLIVVVATGGGKAERLAEIAASTGDERRLPARAALRPGAVWILDGAAAAGLPR